MFVNLFFECKRLGIPVSLTEYLTLIGAVREGLANYSVGDFYYLSRATLVKDERNLDRYDQAFGVAFKGLESGSSLEELLAQDIPEEWLRKLAERYLSEEEKQQIQTLGGFDKLMETLKQRLAEQKERHQGGSKWIGTAGTSPFGAYGYNPEGIRIGQNESRHKRAVKVWDKREFRNLDDTVELGTRNIKVALRRLRKFAREGAATELDLDDTIRATAHQAGMLDLKMVPERHNRVKVLLFLDAGGSMDPFVRLCEELFSAARSEFKHLEHYYFHNCVYENVWRDNVRRHADVVPTWDVINTYGDDYKLIFVGDAAMSPYEIAFKGGSVEHWNEEPGHVWIRRLLDKFSHAVWLNPEKPSSWPYTESTGMIRNLMEGRMFPLSVEGIDEAMRELNH